MIYIFDFDGTLVDSMPVFAQTMIRIFEEHQLPYPDDFIKIITPLGYKGTAKYAMKQGFPLTEEAFVEQATAYNTEAYHHTIPLKNGVKEKLLLLKSRGDSLNVLTASPHCVLDACLKRVGIYHLFDNIWSCEDFGRTKSEPEIYREAAERLGVPVDSCVFVDDNIEAIRTAQLSGMCAVGVFDPSSEDFVEAMQQTADRYIRSFDEL